MGMKPESPRSPLGHLLWSGFIPLAPLSMNAIYQVIWNQRRTQLKPQARYWKTQAKTYVPSMPALDTQSKLHLTLSFYQDWYTKDGSLKIRDVTNYEKLVVDAISEKLRGDDRLEAQLWEVVRRKVQSMEQVGIAVELALLPEEE